MTRDPALAARERRELLALLECPHCAGELGLNGSRWMCTACGRQFRSLVGIPDLRIPQSGAVDYDDDWALASSLGNSYHSSSFSDLVVLLWQGRVSQKIVSRTLAEQRINQILRAPLKYQQDLSDPGWLGTIIPRSGQIRLLEVGCGPGAFLVAAHRHTSLSVGVDLSMAWLIICRKRLEAEGRPALLICGCAERLPFRTDTFDHVVAFDVLEHVADRDRMVGEVHRVTRPGGAVACTTPNRFSLSAEPHHQIWGVGLLPRSWMPGYVQWRTGQEFRFTYPLSTFDIRRLFSRYFTAGCQIVVPELWSQDIETFAPLKRGVARFYNLIIRLRLFRTVLTNVAPFFRIVARKGAAGRA